MEKPKKERTEAQKKATLAMLKARREKKNALVKKNDDSSSEDESPPVEETKKERKTKKKAVVNSISIDIPPTPVAPPPAPKIIEHITKDDLQALRNDIAGMLRPVPPAVVEKNVVKKVKAPKKEIAEASEEEEEYVAPIKIKQERQQQKQESTRQERQVSRNLTGYDLLDALLKR